MNNQGKLVPQATITLDQNLELYRLVDFLNRNLKDEGLLFGLSLGEVQGTMIFSFYRV